MSEFMKQMVNEVLSKQHSPKRNPPSRKTPAQEESSPSSAAGPVDIRRPNYQREQSKKRLSPLYRDSRRPTFTAGTGGRTPSEPPEKKADGQKDMLSSLQRLSLFQVKGLHRSSADGDAGELIGKSREGAEVWFYPHLHPKLAEWLNASGSRRCVGIVSSAVLRLGSLFIAEALLEDEPDIQSAIAWRESREEPFRLRLEAEEPDRLKRILREFYLRLNRSALRRVNAHLSRRPSALLSETLRLQDSRSAAVLEGVSRYEAVALLDRVLKEEPECPVRFAVEEKALLLQGEGEAVRSMLTRLKQEADRLL
ncbi:hypothetical protein [Paludifilum halophilum]|uniref:Uncharacterized protein n=1 Tax=Paludifilum halophilum TaxID=1642702 RepID=A0A235B9Y4_9BACL|nr:hypothetical protein [Paludifilum halophilum]OYD09104.1 hypothetical protein CHM34_04890 [Paludifilum halophilum]